MKERRAFPRLPVELPARCELSGSRNAPFPALVINVGHQGICITAKPKLELEQFLILHIQVKHNETMVIKSRVVWCEDIAGTVQHKIGLKIISAKPEDIMRLVHLYPTESEGKA
ncbi:MAG: PilZ domain-containing protein [Candidatus Omnitrophota bacterium]